MNLFHFYQAKIGRKVALWMLLAVGGLFAGFVAVTTISQQQQAQTDAVANVREKGRLLTATVEVLDRSLRGQVASYARIFADRLGGQFTVDHASKMDVAGTPVSTLALDGKVVNLDFAIPDTFTALTGAYATIFVRQGDDFVRVTTSHKKEDGARAVGTTLDHAHPAYRLLMNGQSYAGSASLFGGQYMTHYEAIVVGKEVIGVLYVGIDFTDSVRLLGTGIKSLQLGQTGSFYVLSARPGKDLGKAVIHRQLEGSNLLAAQDAAGAPYVQTMLSQANGVLHYAEAAAPGATVRRRVAAFSTIKDWQMLVVGDAYLDEITAGAVRQRNHAAIMGLLMVLIVTVMLHFIIRKLVVRPFGQALQAVETVATGNLTARVEATSVDESGRLLVSLRMMTERLANVVTEVRGGTDAITSISAEVAAGNMELSARTEQQAAALEQTASSMEEMTASVRNNADNARHAQALSRTASDTARAGGEAVEQVVAKMDAITASSNKIADITSVVDAIAFQTNILALNAAVEAARAGEHGRGFAVVATEVRTLAQRSGAAAREIKQLINDSLEQVAAGARLAASAGATMREVVGAIVKANDTIDEMSTATQEQASGIDQINRAIAQLDQVTQQNAALVEEAAAAAQTMQGEAGHLAQVVEFFVVERAAAALAPRPSVPATGAGTRQAPRRPRATSDLVRIH
ncbi:Cache 3/Cache 2 fusion domain-containing protein [Massilia sp. PAMC28688]|uniref:methyl-accepting chemotaxis protein n=1 Tax=Massilia sp. PAMC28688 TaxID=2861283 RepID=UPI001C62E1BB|nr:methyl-accepting chemotaxis protein [Massilia sp. PAMC28688]QYF95230.1 Cache 3/Cache 2 fusion domain-containing protein [Massilia sp. PAMC28688]